MKHRLRLIKRRNVSRRLILEELVSSFLKKVVHPERQDPASNQDVQAHDAAVIRRTFTASKHTGRLSALIPLQTPTISLFHDLPCNQESPKGLHCTETTGSRKGGRKKDRMNSGRDRLV